MCEPDSWKALESSCPTDTWAEISIPWHTLEKPEGPRKDHCCTVPANNECTNLRVKADQKEEKIIYCIQTERRSKTSALTSEFWKTG